MVVTNHQLGALIDTLDTSAYSGLLANLHLTVRSHKVRAVVITAMYGEVGTIDVDEHGAAVWTDTRVG